MKVKVIKTINTVKKVLNKHNAKILIKIVAVLLVMLTILYIIPEAFVALFNTFLGKLILFLSIIIVGIYNYKYGIGLACIIIIIYRSHALSTYQSNNKEKEGFTWSQDEITNFLQVQNTTNPQTVYDPNQLQKYASPSEVEIFLQDGKWPWSKDTQNLYTDAVLTNPYVREYKTIGLDSARKVYNEQAIKYILNAQDEQASQAKVFKQTHLQKSKDELPSGWGSFGYNSGLQ
jgi:hypothetical protein